MHTLLPRSSSDSNEKKSSWSAIVHFFLWHVTMLVLTYPDDFKKRRELVLYLGMWSTERMIAKRFKSGKEFIMMSSKRVLLVCMLGGLAVGMCGCRPYIVGTDAGVYSSGKLYAVASVDVAGVYEATLQALGDLELKVTDKAKDVFSAKVVAEGADGKVVTVVITPREDKRTDVNIKVGPFGNKDRSLVIYEQIRKHLPAGGK